MQNQQKLERAFNNYDPERGVFTIRLYCLSDPMTLTRLLVRMADLQGLHTLDVAYNDLGEAGARALAKSQIFQGLHTLNVASNDLGEAGARALAEAASLQGLRTLNVASNDLGEAGARALAKSISLQNLLTLDLRNNQLSSLPPEIGSFSMLKRLDLDGNQLSSLPPEIGSLSTLETLDLRNNQLSSFPPEIGPLSTLETLILMNNQLSSLPPEIGSLSTLKRLDLDSNQLSSLPPEIGSLSTLETLDLDGNQLSSLPPEIGSLSTLETLILRNNQLSSLPPEIGSLSTLKRLDLNGNQLSSLPPEIGSFSTLKRLDLDGNQLSSLPPEIGSLSTLETLDLDGNQLSSLPPEIGSLSTLETLDLRNNQLSSFPPEIGPLSTLKRLDLNGNQLSSLPPEIGSFSTLKRLDLDGNQLSSLPPEIGSLSTLETLDLRNNQLSSFPPEIGPLSTLKRLDLDGNQLSSLPPEIGSFSTLKRLDLDGNQLSSLPPEIGSLSTLETLSLTNNQLSSLPPEIGSLSTLETLSLMNNQLSSFPPEIGSLSTLKRLDLDGNQLSSLPPEIGSLSTLETLDLRNNQLSSLPPEIGSLSTLETLILMNNQLSSLPPEIGSLSTLETLILRNNQLSSLPPEIGSLSTLETLDLRNNQLRELPERLSQLLSLKQLWLRDNPDLGLLDEMMGFSPGDSMSHNAQARPPAEILSVYFSIQAGASRNENRPLNEAKVLFLGEPESGKSSLIYALKHGTPTPNFSQTDGIVREVLRLKTVDGVLVEDGGEPFRLNLWDFGGQEIYKATHTFFLTKRAVYVIVTTARKDTHVNEDLEEWLETAKTFGDGAPVWIVINKHDENPAGGPDEHALMRKYHPMLRGFVRTQCQHGKKSPGKGTGAGLGIDRLRDNLLAEAWAIPESRQPMSPEMLSLKGELEGMEEPTLTVGQYGDICREAGVPDTVLQQSLLDLWDKLGTVRYFPEHEDDAPSMQETAILNPEWITEAVYKVIGDEDLKNQHGLACAAELDRIMKKLKHPAGTHALIANVMRRFSQLYDGDNGQMFIPLLLEDREPVLEWPADALRFIYRYPILPAGLIPSFIAKMHAFHAKAIAPWRKGCVLELQGCRVRVLGDKKQKQVQISVVGDKTHLQRDALDQVRFKFEEFHAGVTGMDALKELVPVPGYPDAPMLDYRLFRTLEVRGRKEHDIPVDEEASDIVSVVVAEVLGNIRGTGMKQREEQGRGQQPVEIGHVENLNLGNKMKIDNSVGKRSINANAQYGQTLANCTNMIQQQAPGDRRELLDILDQSIRKLVALLDDKQQNKTIKNYERFVEEAASAEPDRKWYDISVDGLLEASQWVKDFSGNIAGTLLNLGKKVWGADYLLSPRD